MAPLAQLPGRPAVPIDRPPSTLRRLGAAAAMGLTVATALLAATGVAAAAPPPSSSQVSNSDLAPACPAPSPTGFCTELVGGGPPRSSTTSGRVAGAATCA
jgi:hypothetical protein